MGDNYRSIAVHSVFVLAVATGALLIFLAPFRYAFVSAAAIVVFLLVRSKEDSKKLVLLAFVIIFLFWGVYLFQGQDSHLKILDNLDCHLPQSKVLAESGKAFSLDPDASLDNFINGLPLSGLDSGYNVLTWLLMLFTPFYAYIINDLLIRLVAFIGMVLLLKKYFIFSDEKKEQFIVVGTSLCFSLLPFYPAGGLSISGLPLLLFSYMNIQRRVERVSDYLIILFFPFYSELALAGVFIVIVFFAILVYDGIKRRKPNYRLAGVLALLIVTYVFTHFHLIYQFVNPTFVSFREEIQPRAISTSAAIQNSFWNFTRDRVHVVSAHRLFVIPATVLAIVLGIIKKSQTKRIVLLVMAALATSLLWGFKYWEGFVTLRQSFGFLNAFDIARFYWLNPFLWFLIFGLALCTISKVRYGRAGATALIILQLFLTFVYYNWEYRYLLGVRRSFAGSPETYSLTYKEYFSEELFAEIGRYIDKPKKDYRVVCHGIHPAIANYSGFFSLDVYTDFYPLEYKHRFRRIIEREIEKSPELEEVFDRNAKRCYLLTAELHGNNAARGLAFTRGISKWDQHLRVENLDLNTEALREMGGEYIFSAVELLNFAENGLVFEWVFERDDSPWKIYLYRVP